VTQYFFTSVAGAVAAARGKPSNIFLDERDCCPFPYIHCSCSRKEQTQHFFCASVASAYSPAFFGGCGEK